jgi:hypothetical protein
MLCSGSDGQAWGTDGKTPVPGEGRLSGEPCPAGFDLTAGDTAAVRPGDMPIERGLGMVQLLPYMRCEIRPGHGFGSCNEGFKGIPVTRASAYRSDWPVSRSPGKLVAASLRRAPSESRPTSPIAHQAPGSGDSQPTNRS